MYMKSYFKQAAAYLQGDTDTVIAQRNYRKLSNAIKGQISALNAEKDKKEDALETATEALNKLKYPDRAIQDATGQLQRILDQTNHVNDIEDDIAIIEHNITSLNALQASFDAEEVEAAPAA